MDQRQRAKWERMRVRGKWQYVFRVMLKFTAFTFLAILLYQHFVSRRGIIREALIGELVIILVCGFILGLVSWHTGESKYSKSV
jgi:hypothetical protein